jgi:hypothetical protein
MAVPYRASGSKAALAFRNAAYWAFVTSWIAMRYVWPTAPKQLPEPTGSQAFPGAPTVTHSKVTSARACA